MNLIFCTDHRFLKDQSGAVLSPGQFSLATWKRYKQFFENMVVVARSRNAGPGESLDNMNDVQDCGVSFEFLPSLSSPTAMLLHRSDVARKLTALIDASDVVIVRIPSEIGLLAASIADKSGKPWAVELVSCPWDALWNYGRLTARLYAPLQSWRIRRCVSRAPFSLYVTREFLQRRYPTHGHTVAISDVEVSAASDELRRQRLDRIRQGNRPLVLGLIGSISTKIKGVHTALRALSTLAGQLGNFQFRILGPGDRRPWEKMAEDLGIGHHVRFDGVLPSGGAVLSWLDQVDLFLQPSFQEGLPRTIIEAMSRGCPIIASTTGGIPELLERDVLHAPGDWQKLAELIERMVADRARMEQQAIRNFTTAEDYTSEKLDLRRSEYLRNFAEYAAKRKRS